MSIPIEIASYQSSFSTEFLAGGMYYLVIESDGLRKVKKIVKSD